MKRLFSFWLSLSILFLLAACGKGGALTELEAIQKQLAEMEGYACTATLIRTTERGEKTYETKQYFKATGEYRLELTAPAEVAGNYTLFDGKQLCQYNPRVDSSVRKNIPPSPQRNELFLGQFLKNYMQSEGVSIETAALEDAKCVVLEAVIPGGDPTLATEKLWIDRESLLPVRFVLYDANGAERYRMDYQEFVFDPPLDAALFTIPE